MGLVVTATFAVGLWVILYALDFKSFDGFLLALLIVLIAASSRLVRGVLPGDRGDEH